MAEKIHELEARIERLEVLMRGVLRHTIDFVPEEEIDKVYYDLYLNTQHCERLDQRIDRLSNTE